MKGKILQQSIGSVSIIYEILYIPGGAGFLPSTVLGSGALVVTLRFDMWGPICIVTEGANHGIRHYFFGRCALRLSKTTSAKKASG